MDLSNFLKDISRELELVSNVNWRFEPNVVQAIAIVALLFLLVLTLAQLRKRFMHWHLKGIMPGIAIGFLLALFLEGFLIIGGRTAITGVLGWKNAPEPITTVLDAGRNKLVNVLGVSKEIPSSQAKEDISLDEIMQEVKNLSNSDRKMLEGIVCGP